MARQYRGCKNLVYALLTTDDAANLTYGSVKQLAPVKNVSVTIDQDSETIYADNAAQLIVDGAIQQTKSFEVTAIDPAVVAELLGQDIISVGTGETAKKIVVNRSGAVAPYVAVGYELYDTDSDILPCSYVWAFKGKASFPEVTSQTIDDSTTSNGQTIEFKFIETTHKFTNTTSQDGALDICLPQLGSGYDMTKWDNQVVTPDNYTTALAATI